MTRDGYGRAQSAYDAAEPEDGERVECPECGGSGGVQCDDEDGPYEAECRCCGGTGEAVEVRDAAPRRTRPASTITLPDGTSVVAGDGADFGVVAGSRFYQIRRMEVRR